MCGLAGFVNYPDLKSLVEEANRIQFHRGPDNQGTFIHNNFALAHQRLSIIDLDKRSDQPLVKDDLVIVFNGEIYNYKELRQELVANHPVNFATEGDTEVVLELYRALGPEALHKLKGMFAFAILNIKRNELFIARDPFGIKPVFYRKEQGKFAFASELKTLTKLPGFTTNIDKSGLAASMNYLWLPGERSIFSESRKLGAGHYMQISLSGETTITKYYHLPTDAGSGATTPNNVDQLDNILQDSIARHMVADVPVSAFLSGGLDSSLITKIAKKHNPKLSTYTIATTTEDKKIESMPDDQVYARRLAEREGFDHHEIVIEPNIVELLPKLVYHLDEPIGDPAAINTYLISKEARDKDVKVLLSGMGADEIFFGYRRQLATYMALEYQRLPASVRRVIASGAKKLPVRYKDKGLKLSRWAKRFTTFSDLPPNEMYRRSFSYYDDQSLNNLFSDDFEEVISLQRNDFIQTFKSGYEGDVINKMCQTDIKMFMEALNLTYTDRASMAASVEVRVPFIDKEVIEFAMDLPGEMKYQKRKSKYLLKMVSERHLSKDLVHRDKASFGAPIRSWISGPLRPMVDDLLTPDTIRRRGIFDHKSIGQMIENDRQGKSDFAYQIYQLLTFELWHQTYCD